MHIPVATMHRLFANDRRDARIFYVILPSAIRPSEPCGCILAFGGRSLPSYTPDYAQSAPRCSQGVGRCVE